VKNKLKKINISFLNLAAQSPSIELNFAMSEKIHIESNRKKHVFFMCDRALNSCSVNITHSKSICDICRHKAKKGFKYFNERNPNSELIKVSKKDLNTTKFEKDNKIMDELMLGVHSTIGSQLRLDDMSLLNTKWSNIKFLMTKSSLGLYSYFNNFLKNNNVENFIIFNGRISCARPLKKVSQDNNVNYILFDGARNGMTPYYSKNEMFHSINFEKNNALKTYLKHFLDSRKIASDYSFKKQNKIPILRDIVFTKNQQTGYLDEKIQALKKPLITIFVSSDDEYRYLGSDFGKEPIVDQIDSIYTLVSSSVKDNYDFVVKMHPNQNKSHKSILKKYNSLSKKILTIFPDNKSDSYALIKKSKIIISFSSSIGAEANYLSKPVIQIGPSKWMGLPTANFVKNSNEAIEMILNSAYKIMPKRSSIAYFTFNMKANFKLETYHYIEDGAYTYANKFIKAPFVLRVLAVIPKLYQAFLRGDNEVFTKLYLYIPNLLFGRTKG
tara:strand:- start:1410 stop:2903 length:1494 start_codon:yes stop_codon:yes gene_type:complete